MGGTASFNDEDVCATLSRLLIGRGMKNEAALLAKSKASLQHYDHDNWDGGIDFYSLQVQVPASDYASLGGTVRELETSMAQVLSDIRVSSSDRFTRVEIVPAIERDPDWQRKALQQAAGSAINNQGRVRSDNPAAIEADGLHFRSRPEVNVYRALKSLGVVFAPLPVFLQGGRRNQRIEPDFVIVWNNKMLVLEVDGRTFHSEGAAEADSRTEMLEIEGVQVRHIAAKDCLTPEGALTRVRGLLAKYGVVPKEG